MWEGDEWGALPNLVQSPNEPISPIQSLVQTRIGTGVPQL